MSSKKCARTPPKTPIPREGGPGRPPLRSSAERGPASLSDAEHGSASLGVTEQELTLLKAHQITQITPGQWMHTTQQGDGRIILTPADPQAELQIIRNEARGDAIIDSIGARIKHLKARELSLE